MAGWIVKFNCNEAVYREGAWKECFQPDDLGCLPEAIYPIEQVEVISFWEKNGEMRVKFKRVE